MINRKFMNIWSDTVGNGGGVDGGATWRERSEQSTAENYVDSKMHANTYMHTCTYTQLPPLPPHRHKCTHLHIVGELGPFCRLTGSNISPEQRVRVAMMMMPMVEVVRLGPLPGSPRSLPLNSRLISREVSPTLLMTPIDTDAHHKPPGQEETNV